MPVELTLTVDAQDRLLAACDGAQLAPPTPLASLPALTPDSNPYFYDPRGLGAKLYAALGGDALRERLDASHPRVLYLTADERAAALPWEYACAPGDDFLALHYGFLRRTPAARAAAPAPSGPLYFLALAADPLVNDQGAAVTRRLDVEHELAQIEATLRQAPCALRARRIPPTIRHLQRSLRQGPALLHLSCHGSVETIVERGGTRRMAMLQLEDPNGAPQYLRGDRLVDMAPAGALRLVVFSACLTSAGAGEAGAGTAETGAAAVYANLARAMVQAGAPAAVGMQGKFPDHLSDEFAVALYGALLDGLDLAEALRQARLALDRAPGALGLPVGYVSAAAADSAALWHAAPGQAEVAPLQAGYGHVALPADLEPPAFFVGRERALHDLARAFRAGQEDMALEQQGAAVVTVVGTGGIGKTTLAGAFARRFGWRFAGGVAGATLATLPTLEPAVFLRSLAGQLQAAPPDALAQLDADALADLIGREARARQALLVVDNYESVLQGLEEHAATPSSALHANAQTLHRAAARWAAQGVLLLLTSRQHPAGFAGEVVFPDPRRALAGVAAAAGAELFFHHSTRARQDKTAHRDLARAVAEATEGHPLAIALLAGEFDVSEGVTPAAFLAGWDGELAAAQRPGLAGHHVRFEVAFRRSFDALPPAAQARLVQLSRFPAPFFAAMAARLWNPAADDDAAAAEAAQQLGDFVRRSLLKVDGWYEGGERPATFRFDPATQRTVAARRAGDEDAAGMAAAADWLVSRLYGQTGSYVSLAQLGQQWLQALAALAPAQPDERRPWYAWRLAVIAGQYGSYAAAWTLLELAEDAAIAVGDNRALARTLNELASRWMTRGDLDRALALWERCLALNTAPEDEKERGVNLHEMAYVYVTRGDLDRALGLYQESLAIKEKLGDIRGKSATLHAMANVYVTRGDLDRALGLYQESLAIKEKLGDIRGKSATLHAMANVYVTRGDLDRALGLYQESLATDEKLGDIRGKSATLHAMANVYVTRGDLERALGLYQESLAIQEKLGDISGKSATLHEMAYVYVTRGDLDRALGLYQESLAIQEKLGDIRGKSATLHAMANVYVTRGDLDRALGLYQESLAIKEKLGDIRGKSATLHAMANVYVTRGDLDRALGLYQESLATDEKLGDIRGKSATLHAMANVYVTRGDLDRALGLYQESLAIKEKLGDISGKSATLHEMAYVYVTRGDLERALGLYQESLAIQEKLGDIRGKSATLHAMANVYVTRGDLDRALGLYQESLAIQEKLGDIRGMTTTLSMMANLRMNHAEWDEAEELLTEALRLAGQLKYPSEIAFNTVKLGQVAHGRGDLSTARTRYEEGLSIFQRLGMPEANQVRAMLAALDGDGQPAAPATPGQALLALVRAAGEVRRGRVPAAALQQALAQAAGDGQFSPAMHALLAALDGAVAGAGGAFEALAAAVAPVLAEGEDSLPIPLLSALARFADGSGQPAHAVAWQAQAIDRQRGLPVARDSQEDLSILLYNHAGYLADAGNLAAAVQTLEEVVALDEAWQLPDLASDRQALAAMCRRRDGEPEPADPQALLAGLAQEMAAQLAQLEPAQRAQVEEAMRRFAELSPDEQAAFLASQARDDLAAQIDRQADEIVAAVLRAAAENRLPALLPDLDDAAAAFGDGEAPGSPYAELAAFVAAVAALLRGEPAPAVPAAHVARFAALRGKLQ